jgi:hypothetical protein
MKRPPGLRDPAAATGSKLKRKSLSEWEQKVLLP